MTNEESMTEEPMTAEAKLRADLEAALDCIMGLVFEFSHYAEHSEDEHEAEEINHARKTFTEITGKKML
jgi:hypothetical protein